MVSIDNEEESIIQVYYNYEQKTLLSNTDFEQEFEVYDLNGKTIRQGLISKDAPVDLSMLGNGIYIVKLTAQNNCQTFKIVVL